MRLQGKVALVTGSAANIGRATALLFAAEGAKIVVTTRNNVEGGEAVAAEIAAAGGQAVFVQADLADPEAGERLVVAAVNAFGGLDIVVNNAGVATNVPFPNATRDDWAREVSDNLFGTVSVSQAAARVLPAGGVILNTASIRGLEHAGRQGIMAYSAAKAAVINFSATLAKELAPRIRVNSVSPGFTITPTLDALPKAVKEEFIGGTLIKRWIQPTEIAEGFLYLATADAVTGHNLVIDGGFTLK